MFMKFYINPIKNIAWDIDSFLFSKHGSDMDGDMLI